MKIGMIDIETAPSTAHVWGIWQQNVSLKQLLESSYTMCFAWKWYKERGIEYKSIHRDGELDMLQRAWQLLDECDAVIHYFGSRFDIPTIQKEFLLQGMGPPSPFKQIDLLTTVRKQFKFPSNKLEYLASTLGVGSKVKHEGHELWLKCMAGDEKAWKMMEKYNKQDVALLEKVYNKLLPWINNHPNHGLYMDSDKPACPNCGSTHLQKRGVSRTKTLMYKRYHCNSCGTWSRARLTCSTPEDKSHILVS